MTEARTCLLVAVVVTSACSGNDQTLFVLDGRGPTMIAIVAEPAPRAFVYSAHSAQRARADERSTDALLATIPDGTETSVVLLEYAAFLDELGLTLGELPAVTPADGIPLPPPQHVWTTIVDGDRSTGWSTSEAMPAVVEPFRLPLTTPLSCLTRGGCFVAGQPSCVVPCPVPTAPSTPTAPERPAPPQIMPCREGWRPASLPSSVSAAGATTLTVCLPPERLRCGELEVQTLNSAVCERFDACAGEWPTPPGGVPVVYVRNTPPSTAPTGSMAEPFATIAEAMNVASVGAVIAVARGTYRETIHFSKDVHIVGACATETIFVRDWAAPSLTAVAGTISLENVTLLRGYRGVEVAGAVDARLRNVRILDPLQEAMLVTSARVTGQHLHVRGGRIGSNLTNINGEVVIEDSVIEGGAGPVLATSGRGQRAHIAGSVVAASRDRAQPAFTLGAGSHFDLIDSLLVGDAPISVGAATASIAEVTIVGDSGQPRISVGAGGVVTIERLLSAGVAPFLHAEQADVRLEDVAIATQLPESDATRTATVSPTVLDVRATALTVRRAVLHGGDIGVRAEGDSRVQIADVHFEMLRSACVLAQGALQLRRSSAAAIRETAFEIGPIGAVDGSDLDLERVGHGFSLAGGAHQLARTRIVGSRRGLRAEGESVLRSEHLSVSNADGCLLFQHAARADLTTTALADCRSVGLVAADGADLVVSDLSFADATRETVAWSARDRSHLSARAFDLAGNEGLGIYVSESASVDLHDGRARDFEVGVSIRTATQSVSALLDGVGFVGNKIAVELLRPSDTDAAER